MQDRRLDALSLYEPQPKQADFHACRSRKRILEGGNRSGKSTAAFVEDARIALQRDPHRKIVKRDGLLCEVGFDTKHIGDVIYPKLFRPGAFKIIRDNKTGDWRAWRPWEEEDAAREKETKLAPPLIPERYIAKWPSGRPKAAWFKKNANIFSSVELTTGWTIRAYTSAGKPAQGFAADVIHIDEDLQNGEWATEMYARTNDYEGLFYWSALPHDKNDSLTTFRELADHERDNPNPTCVRFCLWFTENAFISERAKEDQMQLWAHQGDDVLRLRAYGESGTERRMYPSFSLSSHGLDRKELPGREIPAHWSRYLVIDPGHQPASVLFIAVPPPNEKRPAGDLVLPGETWGTRAIVYDELQVLDSSAKKLAEAVRHKVMADVIEDIIIDDHGSRSHDTGSGESIRRQYSEAFRSLGIKSERHGFQFTLGSDNVQGRIEKLRGWMMMADDGKRRLMVLRDSCPKLAKEMERYRKKIESRGGDEFITNKPDTRGIHLAVCLEYAAAADPKYVKPRPKRMQKPEHPLARLRRLYAANNELEHGKPYIACSAGGK